MTQSKQPSIIAQLILIAKNFEALEYYEYEVSSANDLEDAIFYSKLKDKVNAKIKEIEERAKCLESEDTTN